MPMPFWHVICLLFTATTTVIIIAINIVKKGYVVLYSAYVIRPTFNHYK